jgi:oxaloacetate decarboxylase gamma subunit
VVNYSQLVVRKKQHTLLRKKKILCILDLNHLFGGFMTIATMLGQSAILTVLGMSVVMGFIVIMIIALGFVQKFLHALRLDVDETAEPVFVAPAPAPAPAQVAASSNNAVIAAIAAAVKVRGQISKEILHG